MVGEPPARLAGQRPPSIGYVSDVTQRPEIQHVTLRAVSMTAALRGSPAQRVLHIQRAFIRSKTPLHHHTMSSFTLPTSTGSQPCKVTLCPGLSKDQLLSHKPFTQWLSTLQSNLKLQWNQSHAFYDNPYNLRSIEVQAVDRFGHDRIGFVKFRAVVENGDGETLPAAVFLRGGSVAMLVRSSWSSQSLPLGVITF